MRISTAIVVVALKHEKTNGRGIYETSCGRLAAGKFHEMSASRVESDLGLGLFGRWEQERTNLLIKVAQGGVVGKQGFVYFGEAFGDRRVGAEFLAHPHKGANDIDAHGLSPVTIENICSLERAMFGEGEGAGAASAAPGL